MHRDGQGSVWSCVVTEQSSRNSRQGQKRERMRVLITGHKGYIGTVMAPLLADAGHEIMGLDSDLFEQCTFGEAPREFPSIHKDIRDVEQADLEGIDAVIHLAGLSNDPLGNLNADL